MPRAWITGRNGFVGRRLVPRLLAERWTLVGAERTEQPDIADWDAVKTVPPFDVVVHLAARTFVPGSLTDPREYYRVNTGGTLNVLELCRLRRARLVYISAYVYGAPQYLPVDERHPVQATNPYTQSKLLAEDLCRAYHRDFGVASTILRVFNIYGPGQTGDFLIASIVRQLQTGRIVLQDPAPRRDFVHVDDVADACMRAMAHESAGVDCFNIGSGTSISVEDLVRQLVAASGKSAAIEFTGVKRDREIPDTRCDNSKARKHLGWEPRVRLEDGIRDLVRAAFPSR